MCESVVTHLSIYLYSEIASCVAICMRWMVAFRSPVWSDSSLFCFEIRSACSRAVFWRSKWTEFVITGLNQICYSQHKMYVWRDQWTHPQPLGVYFDCVLLGMVCWTSLSLGDSCYVRPVIQLYVGIDLCSFWAPFLGMFCGQQFVFIEWICCMHLFLPLILSFQLWNKFLKAPMHTSNNWDDPHKHSTYVQWSKSKSHVMDALNMTTKRGLRIFVFLSCANSPENLH